MSSSKRAREASATAPHGSARKDLILLLALGAAAAAFIGWLVSRSARTTSALEAVPADSFIVGAADVWALAQSPLGSAILGNADAGAGHGPSYFGMGSIKETCGFEPLEHLRTIVIAIPEHSERGDFGVAATGDLAKDALAQCAKDNIAKHGGKPVTRTSGTFTVVSDETTPRSASVAFREGGPFLLGQGPWLEKMIATAEGHAPSYATSSEHAAIRADLAKRDADAEALIVTAVVPRSVRERIQKEMETGDADGGTLGAQMEGVLAVSSGGIALHAGRANEDTRIVGEVRCDNDRACASVETLILHQRLGWSGDLRLRLGGLGPLIDGLDTQRPEPQLLVVKTRAPAVDVAKLLDRVLHPSPASPATTPSGTSPAPGPGAGSPYARPTPPGLITPTPALPPTLPTPSSTPPSPAPNTAHSPARTGDAGARDAR